jgi:hypothetical protein
MVCVTPDCEDIYCMLTAFPYHVIHHGFQRCLRIIAANNLKHASCLGVPVQNLIVSYWD